MSLSKKSGRKTALARDYTRVRKTVQTKRGARIAIVDVENNNPAGIRFVQGLDFKQAESYIWFSKNIEE